MVRWIAKALPKSLISSLYELGVISHDMFLEAMSERGSGFSGRYFTDVEKAESAYYDSMAVDTANKAEASGIDYDGKTVL